MPLPRVPPLRRAVQIASALLVLAIGVQFTSWVLAHQAGRPPPVPRPPGVDAFLPIDGLLGLRHLVTTGEVDPVHPAAIAVLVAIVAMSTIVARAFCSHVCPVGLASEILGRTGERLLGRTLRLPRWVDVPLRGLRYLLLAFFLWAAFLAMDARQVAAFLDSPYARVADVKMWLFFRHPSTLTLGVVGGLAVASLFVRDAWCRTLCPYGALLGLVGLLAPGQVTRDPDRCTGCAACTRACPARLDVHTRGRVRSPECTGCQDCVAACPIPGCLAIRPPGRPTPADRPARRRVPLGATLVATGVFLAVVLGFRLAGHWRSSVSDAEAGRRIRDIHGPAYHHAGGSTR